MNEIAARRIEDVVSVKLPTEYGVFQLMAYKFHGEKDPTLALVYGEVRGCNNVPVRMHSSCVTGDIFGSLRCDCGPQLRYAMNYIAKRGCGAIIYLHQEGREIGLLEKLKAYRLQEGGLDTVEANEVLGLPVDCREYSAASAIIQRLGMESIELMTNNPEKQRCLESSGVIVRGRVPVVSGLHPHNKEYLKTKIEKMSHAVPIELLATNALNDDMLQGDSCFHASLAQGKHTK